MSVIRVSESDGSVSELFHALNKSLLPIPWFLVTTYTRAGHEAKI